MEGRNQIPIKASIDRVKKTEPLNRYKGDIPFAEWQEKTRAHLAQLLGLPIESEKKAPTVEYTEDRGDFTEIRFITETEENYFVPAHLWIPKNVPAPMPLIVCLQGHSTGMHISMGRPKHPGDEKTISGGDRDFAVRAIKEGYAALVIEQRCFGECGGNPNPDCAYESHVAMLMGRTLVGERVHDVDRVLDSALTLGDFDENSLAVMGNSGGGTTSFYVGCMLTRFSTVMPSCAVCTYEDSIVPIHHCACNYIPGIRKYYEMGTLAGLIAPRRLIIVAGQGDNIFPINGVKKTMEEAGELFAAAGCPDNISLVVGPEGHRFYADLGWAELKKEK